MVNVLFPSSIYKFNLLVNAINEENNNNLDTNKMSGIINSLVQALGFDFLCVLLENELLLEFNKLADMLEVNLNVKHNLELEINQLSEQEKVEVKGILIEYKRYIYKIIIYSIQGNKYYLINPLFGGILDQLTLLTHKINIQDTELINPNLLKKIFETPTQLEQFTLILKELENKVLPEIKRIILFLKDYQFVKKIKDHLNIYGLINDDHKDLILFVKKVKTYSNLYNLSYNLDKELMLDEDYEFLEAIKIYSILENIVIKSKEVFLDNLNTDKYKLEYIKCNCGADDYTILSKVLDINEIKISQVICKECGLVYLNPRMNPEAYDDYYEKHYRNIFSITFICIGWELEESIADRTLSIFNTVGDILKTEKLNILEIGCGHGQVVEKLKACGHNVMGIDLDHNAIENGKRNGLNVKEAHTMDLVEEYSCKFDLIITIHVVEHFLNLDEELRNIKKLLKPEGQFYIEVPGSIKNNYSESGSIPHTYYFNLCTLTNVMNRNGFELVNGTEYINAVYKINENIKPQIDINNYKETIKVYENNLKLNNK